MIALSKEYIDGVNLNVGDMISTSNYLIKTNTYGVHDICLINLYEDYYQFYYQNLKPDSKYVDEFSRKIYSDDNVVNVYQQYIDDMIVVESIAIKTDSFLYFINQILNRKCEEISTLSLEELYEYSLEVYDYMESQGNISILDLPQELHGVITVNIGLGIRQQTDIFTR